MVPNDGGRVVDPQTGEPVRGSYVAGWIKRGPDRLHRHQQVVRAADRAEPGRRLQRRSPDRPGGQARRAGQAGARAAARTWSTPPDGSAIDAAEIARGGEDRPRDKFTAVADMLAAAATAPQPPLRQRVLAGLRR